MHLHYTSLLKWLCNTEVVETYCLLQFPVDIKLFNFFILTLFFSCYLPQVMSFNSSSKSSNSILSMYLICQQSVPSNVIYTMYTFTNGLLLFPLYIFILYTGFQHWRSQSSAPAGTKMSHSEFFTYNMMILEIFGVFGSIFYSLSMATNSNTLLMLGVYFFCVIFPGQILFHVLTCVDCYLGVVHPITYVRLREQSGIQIKIISTSCVWLVCVGWVGIVTLYYPSFPTVPFLSLGICLLVIIFCCSCILRTLTRPRPGHTGGNKDRVDQSKQRAFHRIAAIMGVMMLRIVGLLVCFVVQSEDLIALENLCVLLDLEIWLSVPSSLVLPLLLLHRTGKLTCIRKKTEST